MIDIQLKKLLKSIFVTVFGLLFILLSYHVGEFTLILNGYHIIFVFLACIGAVYMGGNFGILIYDFIKQIEKRKRKNEIDGT